MDPYGRRYALPGLTPAIKLLVIANAAVFAANAVLLGRLSDPVAGGSPWFACSWRGLSEGYGLGLLRLLSYQFTHSFTDPMHLLLNMLVLWFFGTMAEQRLGYRGTLKLYLAGGLAGALLHLGIAALQGAANVPLVGASGACYGCLLYAACVAPRSQVILFVVPVPLWGLAALLVGIGAYSTFVELATGFQGGVAHGAHLGGALVGFLAHRSGLFVDHVPPGLRPGLFGGLRRRWQTRAAEARAGAAAARELQL
ncbi:MAG: rhomboid family intramembrane serine protease, partial [Planctomycetes bacterium]|nr:rhomboid family intramembrane serine protease [Planctomycetota bacterium]